MAEEHSFTVVASDRLRHAQIRTIGIPGERVYEIPCMAKMHQYTRNGYLLPKILLLSP